MQPRTDRHPRAHLWRRAVVACLATAVTLAATGCAASSTPNQQSTGTPAIVTAQQVITSCYHNYFYNGILPQSAARSNCSACVEQKLRKLGFQPSPGQNELDLLTGVQLPTSAISSLQSACNVTDASAQ